MGKTFNIGSIVGGAPVEATQRREHRQIKTDQSEAMPVEAAAHITRGKGRPRKTDGSKGAYFVVDADQLTKVQQIAKDNGLQIKQVLGKALASFIEAYEAKHGTIKVAAPKDINELI